ncbi:MAG: polysaccharide pyruvyl transferase family protein [Lachnospiraceae bacterium]|nr:polysaccharide pyruvyl transferase family protein [Lachnospiraceae bacterium]
MTKIGILTFHRACNYGAFLQAYALRESLNDLEGVQAEIIDYRSPQIEARNSASAVLKKKGNPLKKGVRFLLDYPVAAERNAVFEAARKTYFGSGPSGRDAAWLRENAGGYDVFVTGSDQVWNTDITGDDPAYFLDFVQPPARAYSYAASIGKSELDEEELRGLAGRLRHFSAVSVREKDILPGLRGLTGDIPLCSSLDPVFLFSPKRWRSFEEWRERKPYVLFFMMGQSKGALPALAFAREYAARKGQDLLYLSDYDLWYRHPDLRHAGIVSPPEFVGLLDHAECVVTNSFHATAFSIILHKKFFVETRVLRSNRILNLLDSAGLLKRGLDAGARPLDTSPIRWADADERLADEIARSREYLQVIAGHKTI